MARHRRRVCVECRVDADCTDRPTCGTDHTCLGCYTHEDCASRFCDTRDGTCIAEAEAVYVATTGTANPNCTLAQPCDTLQRGVNAVSSSRRNILVAAGSYREHVSVAGESFYLDGAGATLSATATGAPLFAVAGASILDVWGLQLSGAIDAPGLACDDLSGTPIVALHRLRVDGGNARGIDSLGCTLTVRDSVVDGNQGGAVRVSRGDVALRNNFFTRNGTATGTTAAVVLDLPASMEVVFNTFAGNEATSGLLSTLDCRTTTPRTLSNNIIIVAEPMISTQNCAFTYTLSNRMLDGSTNLVGGPVFINVGAGDYHLQPGSDGIDAADPNATVPTDFDGDARPQGLRADIGADEVVAP